MLPSGARQWRRRTQTHCEPEIDKKLVTRIGWSLWTVSLAVAVGGLVVSRLAGGASALIELVVAAAFATLGAFVLSRQPANAIGWLSVGLGLVAGTDSFAQGYAVRALVRAPGSLPGGLAAAWFQEWDWLLLIGLGPAFLLLLFPDGRLPSPRWRPVAWMAAVGTALAVAGLMFKHGAFTDANSLLSSIQNPVGADDALAVAIGALFLVGLVLLLGAVLASVVSLVVRFRGAEPDQRQQIKWFAYGGSIYGLIVVIAAPFWPVSPIPQFLIPLSFVLAPVTVGVAILKHRLYDIDVVISRTLVYGALAAFITALYVGIAVGIGSLVGSGGRPNLGLSILATAIVAVGFQPLRTRLQRIANRLVYGTRATPYEVLSEFSGRVAETYAADEVLPRMAMLLQAGTGAVAATVWLRAGDQLRPAATYPPDVNSEQPIPVAGQVLPEIVGSDHAVAVLHRGDLLGALSITKRRGETLTVIEEKLFADLANQAGLVLKNVGLAAELLQRIDELRASRQRLVAAQDAERRRLERNLHDGAQQHLVALKVKLGLTEMLVQRDPERALVTLRQLKSDADEALETLRDLARGVYPPLLADKGLLVALESQARKATLPITVDADGAIRRYPQELEAAVYFCVLEALQNVQKYSAASRAVVRVCEDGGRLRFDVEDDGRGFDPVSVKKGSGLINMTDRLDALGGDMKVDSRPGGGCRLHGSLPLPVAALV